MSNAVSDQVAPTSAYPQQYEGPKPIGQQIGVIASCFHLNPDQALEYAEQLPRLPEYAEGWFAVPTVDALATSARKPEVRNSVEKHLLAISLVLGGIAVSQGSFRNRETGMLTPEMLRIYPHTQRALDRIALVQKGDILIVAAQLGIRHRGCSVSRVRERFLAGNEFCLDAVAVGSILLTHPERLTQGGDLEMDCPGDKVRSQDTGILSRAPRFSINAGPIEFGTAHITERGPCSGSVTAFLPIAA